MSKTGAKADILSFEEYRNAGKKKSDSRDETTIYNNKNQEPLEWLGSVSPLYNEMASWFMDGDRELLYKGVLEDSEELPKEWRGSVIFLDLSEENNDIYYPHPNSKNRSLLAHLLEILRNAGDSVTERVLDSWKIG